MSGFDIDKTVDYWRAGARYDLGVASALMKARKYPYALKSIRRVYRWLADQLRRS